MIRLSASFASLINLPIYCSRVQHHVLQHDNVHGHTAVPMTVQVADQFNGTEA